MFWAIFCSILSFIAGCTSSYVIFNHTMNNKLRKRGYTIVNDGYYSPVYYFVYTGFDKNMESFKVKGAEFKTRADAIANAEAHYHAKILYDLEKPISTLTFVPEQVDKIKLIVDDKY